MSKKPTLEDVRLTLEQARTHIETKWFSGQWFEWVNPDTGEKSADCDVPDGGEVVGVCLAGSVLYALDYLDERWTEKAKVVPVIEALFENLPARSAAVREFQAIRTASTETSWKDPATRIYSYKLEAIINWNDQRGRKKQQVLDLIDRTIKDVVARMAPSIEEQP